MSPHSSMGHGTLFLTRRDACILSPVMIVSVCLFVCLFVCLLPYLRSYMSQLREILHNIVTYDRGSVFP